jgi:putative membrane protein
VARLAPVLHTVCWTAGAELQECPRGGDVQRHDRDMAVIAQLCALIAAVVHIAAFVMESLLFHRPAVQRLLLRDASDSAAVRLWAFNQGFYNLFVATGAVVGVILWATGHETAGRTLVIYTCAFMALAGVVLFVSDRSLWRGMIGQSGPPLVGLAAALAA